MKYKIGVSEHGVPLRWPWIVSPDYGPPGDPWRCSERRYTMIQLIPISRPRDVAESFPIFPNNYKLL